MSQVAVDVPAPDFELADFHGDRFPAVRPARSEERAAGLQPGLHLTVLPRAHGAVAPGPSRIRERGRPHRRGRTGGAPRIRPTGKNDLPFVGLPDPAHTVLKLYGQEIKLFKMGRMPAQVLVDKAGMARFVHYGHDMTRHPQER